MAEFLFFLMFFSSDVEIFVPNKFDMLLRIMYNNNMRH